MGWVGPAVAGSWYPASPERRRDDVEGFLDRASVPAAGETLPAAVIAPHAGYMYSGGVAGEGFRRLRGATARRVVLLGPTHYFGFRGAVVPEAAAYRTPLGDVPVDRDATDRLAGSTGFRADDRPFGPEHSLEAEIPFLQRALAPGFTLVPVLVGQFEARSDAETIAGAIADLLAPGTLLVVSSDFTHYGPRFGYVPFRKDVPGGLRRLDLDAVKLIASGDAEAFVGYMDETGATICGRRPIELAMRALGRRARGRLVAYDTSGRMTGDWEHSVSYASVAMWRSS